MVNDTDILFEYLKNLMYNPKEAHLDLAELGEDFQHLGQGLLYFGECINEQRDFANALAKGNLSLEPPSRENELAAPLKALQASLRHITWQSQQVAKGDYGQKINFMGEFAEAFNTMIQQLDHRQKELVAKIEESQRKTAALEQNNKLLEAMGAGLPDWIIVVNNKTKEYMHYNQSALLAMDSDKIVELEVEKLILDYLAQENPNYHNKQLSIVNSRTGKRYLEINTYNIQWDEEKATTFVFSDVSKELAEKEQLENYAYFDELTRLDNRHRGMMIYQQWLAERREFCLCFIDLDNLKYINDTFGHNEGDYYIITAAKLLSGLASKYSEVLVCRLGGDEFMLLIDEKDPTLIETQLINLRKKLGSKTRNKSSKYPFSLSFGIVKIEKNEKRDASELLRLADERMYLYKRANKNMK